MIVSKGTIFGIVCMVLLYLGYEFLTDHSAKQKTLIVIAEILVSCFTFLALFAHLTKEDLKEETK